LTIVPIAEATGSIDLGKLNINGTDVYGSYTSATAPVMGSTCILRHRHRSWRISS